MSRHQAIEQALISINETVFQELCDRFLALRNINYAAFIRSGIQTGKQKTIKGTPDSFFLLKNGNYIFVETTTNISDKEKLTNDIKACFEIQRTKIPTEKIEEIVLCFNFNLNPNELANLYQLCTSFKKDVKFTCWSLDALSIELHMHHKDLVHEYLGLPFDTGQIVSIENFIKEYNRAANGISTPIDNEFVHRKKEEKDLIDAIIISDFVILTGPPGVGKTRLAIESIQEFLRQNLNFSAYCISYKHYSLLEDLYQYIDRDKDYILFIDDANRIDAFSQITGFYNAARNGKLKILVTVRDYAFKEIGVLCQNYNPRRLDVSKLTDEQITEIIKSEPFGIIAYDFQREIIRIADGNPRLAIMAALLANEKQDLHALYDVSDLFDKYFSTFIKDKDQFADNFNLQCLGVISFFYTLPINNKQLLSGILKNFELNYFAFIDAIDLLDKLELVEIRFDHVKIPEQNLSVYFFYKAFIKDKILSFKILLQNYFESNLSRFNDCIIPANNTFGPEKVMNKLKSDLKDYWNEIKNDVDKGYNFLSTFWFYLQDDTFEFIYYDINSQSDNIVSNYDGSYKQNSFQSNNNRTIALIGEFFRFETHLKDAIELAFLYIRKNASYLPEVIHKIREKLLFDESDARHRFQRQTTLFDFLISGLNSKDPIIQEAFYELAKSFLNFKFNHTKGGRNHTFYWYDYPIPLTKEIQFLRSKIWESIERKYFENSTKAFNVLKSYSSVTPDAIKEIMLFDLPYILHIINNNLSIDSFEHCRYVQDQIKWFLRNDINDESFAELKAKFINPTYQMYLKIDWNRLRDKEQHEFDNYREYEELKEKEIRSSFVFKTTSEVDHFYESFVFLKKASENEWNYDISLEFVIDENFKTCFDIGHYLLELIIQNNNEVNLFPRVLFRNLLKTKEYSEKIWQLIQYKSFKYKIHWVLAYFDYIDETLLEKSHAQLILNGFNNINESTTLNFERLKRYLNLIPDLFQRILETIFYKNESGDIKVSIWKDFFGDNFENLGDDRQIIESSYIQQYFLQNHFDYKGKGFEKILGKDPKFLIRFIEKFVDYDFKTLGNHIDLSFVWKIDNIEEVLIDVFSIFINSDHFYGILEHSCNSFFRNLNDVLKSRADKFLIDYVTSNNNDIKKMNVVIDITRHSRQEIFEMVVLHYLSMNQNVETFKRIWWIGNGGSYSGDVIIGDIRAAAWREIFRIVDKSDIGIGLLPIKKYINDVIESEIRSGDRERQSRFLDEFWNN